MRCEMINLIFRKIFRFGSWNTIVRDQGWPSVICGVCSNCGFCKIGNMRFCPKCGFRMKLKERTVYL